MNGDEALFSSFSSSSPPPVTARCSNLLTLDSTSPALYTLRYSSSFLAFSKSFLVPSSSSVCEALCCSSSILPRILVWPTFLLRCFMLFAVGLLSLFWTTCCLCALPSSRRRTPSRSPISWVLITGRERSVRCCEMNSTFTSGMLTAVSDPFSILFLFASTSPDLIMAR